MRCPNCGDYIECNPFTKKMDCINPDCDYIEGIEND